MKHTKHSIKSYSKDLSEAHKILYKSMKGHPILAWFLKKKKNTKYTNHVNKTKNRGIPIIVEEERWDANRGIPKLRSLSILEIFTWGAMGIPKI